MTPHLDISELSTYLFWDTDTVTLDPEVHASYIITRVMDRGSLNDVKLVWETYGAQRVREVLTQCRCLNRRTISFFAHYFGIESSAFRAFSVTESGQTWDVA